MIGFFILIVLLIAFYSGGRRGAPLQLVYTIGYVLSFLFALANYQTLADKIELYVPYMSVTEESTLLFYDQNTALDLDKVYYAAVAFLILLFIGWLLVKVCGIFLSDLRFRRFRFLKGYDWLVAGGLNVIIVYLSVFYFLTILSMIPLATVQNIFEKSFTARIIVENSPILTNFFHKVWFTSIIG